MDQDLRDAWVARLRSGDYVQTGGRMKREEPSVQHCCLGVLGEELVAREPEKWSWKHDQWDDGSPRLGLWLEGEPDAYVSAFGYEAGKEIGLPDTAMSKLINMNDWMDTPDEPGFEGRDFNGIADWIEENL